MDRVIKELLEDHAPRAAEMRRLWDAYWGDVPILEREFEDETKINNKLANDYRGDIIDTVVGYLWGDPISYEIDRQVYADEGAEGGVSEEWHRYNSVLSRFNVRNAIDDLDSETGLYMSVCGYAARLLYIDRNGEERVMNVPPWEVVFIYDASHDEPQYAMRYYTVQVDAGDGVEDRIHVEWYDGATVTEYQEDDSEAFVLVEDARPHLFDGVPLVEFPNNGRRQGDFEKVESLIDAYDRTLSDAQNEVEEFRQAYLAFKGAEIDGETIRAARRTGAFSLPPDSDAKFLTKDIIDAFIENHKASLNSNIYKFAKSVDMQDENFSGAAQSGTSRKWKLLGLENKAITKERKFGGALRRQFAVLATAWHKKGIGVDPLAIYWTMKRNLPVDHTDEAQATAQLRGHVSERTRLSLLSFVDDVEWEIEQMRQEREDWVTLPEFDDDEGGEDELHEGD